jgi:hypothetical protein
VKKYSEVVIGMVHFVELANSANLAIKRNFEVFLNVLNGRKEHNYQRRIISKINLDDYYWS